MKQVALILLLCLSAGAAGITLTPGKPADVGMDSGILAAGVNLYRQAIDRDHVRSAVLLVARKGRVVVHEALGWKDKEEMIPITKDAMFRMASNTKAVVATGIAILAERGSLDLADPVHHHLPSFDNERAREMTLHQLLTHTSGFRIKKIFFEPLVEKSSQHPDGPSLSLEVDRFGEVGAAEPVGKSYKYNNAGYNTLGAVIEVTASKPLEVFLQRSIYGPLGMKDSYHHEVAEKLDGKLDRMSTVYYWKDDKWTRGWTPGQAPKYPFVRASGGMISTTTDYAAFCQMILNGGVYNGRRILKEETVRQLTEPHTKTLYTPAELAEREHFYGYGWRVQGDGVFSHTGSDGTAAWVDPKQQLIVLVFTQSPSDRNKKLRDRFFKLAQLSVN